MPKASPFQSNFNGGEFGPLVYGRLEADRYKTGMEICENYLPTIQGALIRRPATRFSAEPRYRDRDARLRRFKHSTTQAYMLEFGHLYMRPFMNGGQILETTYGQSTITAVTNANPGVFTMSGQYNTDQEVYLSGLGGMTQLNGRNFRIVVINNTVPPYTYSLKYLDGTAVDTTAFAAYTGGGISNWIYEIATPYEEQHLMELDFAQNNDVMWITHKNYEPRRLTRTGHTNWLLGFARSKDGPWLGINSTTIAMTVSGVAGTAATVTASAATFASTDVGRLIRINIGTWVTASITAYTSPTVVTVNTSGLGPALVNGGPHLNWRLGAWSVTTGYPQAVTFHDDRLCFAIGQRIDMSVVGAYSLISGYLSGVPIIAPFSMDFAPTAADGTTITGSHAISITLNSNDVQEIQWLQSEEKALLAGTTDGEWPIKPGGDFFSPNFVPSARQATSYGSAKVKPVYAGKAVIFAQASKKQIRELAYRYEVDGFRSPDRSVLHPGILGIAGCRQIAYQKSPFSLVWFAREDGTLVGMTYEAEDESLILGFHRHPLGGASSYGGAPPQVRSVETMPASDGIGEETWLLTKRYVGGVAIRAIEYFGKPFDDEEAQENAFFVDCGLTYDSPLAAPTAFATVGGSLNFTINGHGLVDGDRVRLYSTFVNYTVPDEDPIPSLYDRKVYTVANATTNTFTLTGLSPSADDEFSGGFATLRKQVTQISGLWHLEGAWVDVVTDGAYHPQKLVANGAITLNYGASIVHIGFAHRSRGRMLRLDAGSADGTSFGKTRRTHRVGFYLFRTNHLSIGPSFQNLKELPFRKEGDDDGAPVPLYTGIRSEEFDADYDFENQISWQQSKPLPGTILAIFPQMHTEDRG